MIPVYICDDELPIRKNLEQIVGNQILILDSDMGPVRALEDPEELLVLQRQDSVPAIYFLDIDFPGKMSGLELAQKLRQYDPRGFIVFITAHNDLAFETFRLRLEALDYIVKGDRAAMTGRVQSCLESIRERMESQRPGQGSYCTVTVSYTHLDVYKRQLHGLGQPGPQPGQDGGHRPLSVPGGGAAHRDGHPHSGL